MANQWLPSRVIIVLFVQVFMWLMWDVFVLVVQHRQVNHNPAICTQIFSPTEKIIYRSVITMRANAKLQIFARWTTEAMKTAATNQISTI